MDKPLIRLLQERDIVYHHKYGKGIVGETPADYEKYKVGIKFEHRTDTIMITTEYLSFTPYSLEKGGFSQDYSKRVVGYDFTTSYERQLNNLIKRR